MFNLLTNRESITLWDPWPRKGSATDMLGTDGLQPPIYLFPQIPQYLSYALASFYTKCDVAHFLINTASLFSILLPHLPQFHRVHLFGINKYWEMGLEMTVDQRAVTSLPSPYCLLYLESLRTVHLSQIPRKRAVWKIGLCRPSPAKSRFLWIRNHGKDKGQISPPQQEAMFRQLVWWLSFPDLPPCHLLPTVLLYIFLRIKKS